MPTQLALPLILYSVAALAVVALAYGLGYYGSGKGYSFWLCFMLGLLTSPFIGWIVIALLPERENKYTPPIELMLAIEQEKLKMKADQARAVQPDPGA